MKKLTCFSVMLFSLFIDVANATSPECKYIPSDEIVRSLGKKPIIFENLERIYITVSTSTNIEDSKTFSSENVGKIVECIVRSQLKEKELDKNISVLKSDLEELETALKPGSLLIWVKVLQVDYQYNEDSQEYPIAIGVQYVRKDVRLLSAIHQSKSTAFIETNDSVQNHKNLTRALQSIIYRDYNSLGSNTTKDNTSE